jgi:toxin ParE1/3/4
MSSPNNYILILSEDARADIKGILSYTLQSWGEDQQIKYSAMLDAALQTIQSAPTKGRRHPKLSEVFRYHHVGRHYIVYRLDGNIIEVVRVLHDQMDLPRHVH